MSEAYTPQNTMHLWWLGDGPEPQHVARPIGQLHLVEGNRKVALEYHPGWLQSGFALSDDLPLARGLYLPRERDTAAGAVDDARPDRWGERVIRNLYQPVRLSILEYLYFAGDDRFGALGVSLDPTAYRPRAGGALASLSNLGEMQGAIDAVLRGEQLDERLTRLVKPGPSFGGARPKSLIEMDGFQWVVKFSEGETFDTQLVEHTTLRLAAACGIHVAQTKALPLPRGHAVAVKRFDRIDRQRLHVISANTVLRAAGLPLGYPELAQSLRRLARADAIREHQQELYRRMIFNILMDNTDDHEKNHALIRAADGYYDLSPAYDVVPSVSGLGQQQLRVGKRAGESSLDNALSEANAFGLKQDAAVAVVQHICGVVDGWIAFFRSNQVTDRDIQEMAQYIDGPTLQAQRVAFLAKRGCSEKFLI